MSDISSENKRASSNSLPPGARRPYQPPQLARLSLEADRVLGLCMVGSGASDWLVPGQCNSLSAPCPTTG